MKSELFWIILVIGIVITMINGCGSATTEPTIETKYAEEDFGPKPYLWSDGKNAHFKFLAQNRGNTWLIGPAVLTGYTEKDLITIHFNNIKTSPTSSHTPSVIEGSFPFEDRIEPKSINLCFSVFETSEGHASTLPPMTFSVTQEKLEKRMIKREYPLTINPLLTTKGKIAEWKLFLNSTYPSEVTVCVHVVLTEDNTKEIHDEKRTIILTPGEQFTWKGSTEFKTEITSVTINPEAIAIHLSPIEK